MAFGELATALSQPGRIHKEFRLKPELLKTVSGGHWGAEGAGTHARESGVLLGSVWQHW